MTFTCRAPEPEDLDFIYQLENIQEHWNASDIHQPLSKEVLKQWLFSGVDVYASKHLRLIICLNGKSIGCVDLSDIDFYHKHAHVAVLLQKEHRGIGAASYALDYLAAYAKNSLDLCNLFAEVSTSNNSSCALFNKCDYREIGKRIKARKEGDKYMDIVIFQRSL